MGVSHTAQPGPLSRLTEHLPVSWWLGGVVSELAKGALVHSHQGLKSWLGDSAGGNSMTQRGWVPETYVLETWSCYTNTDLAPLLPPQGSLAPVPFSSHT